MIGYVGNLLGTKPAKKMAMGGLSSQPQANPFGAPLGQSKIGKFGDAVMGQTKMQKKKPEMLQATTQGQLNKAQQQQQQALGMQQGLAQQLAAQQGMQNQANVFGQQQGLADQLALQAQGGGPNPALAQFQQATGQNVANQAALMASQRGAGANVGLMARQAAQQGAAIEQGAAGQLAAQQAQQQLNAQQQLMAQQGQMQNVAGQQVQNQMMGAQNYGQMAQAGQNAQLGAAANLNQINAQIAQQNAKNKSGFLGNLLGGVGNVLTGNIIGAAKNVGNMFSGSGSNNSAMQGAIDSGGYKTTGGTNFGGQMAAEGGMIHDLQSGGKVDGRAKVEGDSYKNDTVPAILSPGEIVIPRSVVQSHDPVGLAAQFVHHTLSKKNYADGGQVTPDLASVIAQRPINDPYQNMSQIGAMAPVMPQPIPQQPLPQQQLPQHPLTSGEFQQTQQQLKSDIPTMESSFEDMRKSLKAQAQNQSDLAKQEANIYGGLMKQQAAARNKYEQQIGDAEKEHAALMKDYQESKIDPQRFMGKMDTGAKVATAIGLILGGMHVEGGENQAAKYLQDQINADIEAQKADLGKKENLLAYNLKQTGNLKDAYQLTQANMLGMAEMQLKQAALRAQNPIQAEQANMEAAKLNMQQVQLIGPIKQKQETLKGLYGGEVDPATAISVVVPENEQAKAREELAMMQGYNDTVKAVKDIFARAKEAGSISSSIPFSGAKAAFEGAQTQVNSVIRQGMKGQGAITDNEEKSLINPQLPGKYDTVRQLEEKEKSILSTLKMKVGSGTPTLKGNGIDLDRIAGTSRDPVMQMDPQTRALVIRAQERLRANPNDKNAAYFLQQHGV